MSVLHALRSIAPARVLMGLALVLLVTSCGSSSTPAAPESAFRSFRGGLRAVARGADATALWSMLGPETRARLEARAQAARAAGVADATPEQMLDVAWAAFATDIESVDTIESRDNAVVLEVRTHHGRVWHVDAVRGESGWTFELPEPGTVPTSISATEREDG